jgi:hypothetical protein
VADWPPEYDQVFSRLKSVQTRSGGHWASLCPAHDDEHHSFSIGLGARGQLMVKCQAPHGCSFDKVCAALQLRPGEFFPKGSGMADVKHTYVTHYEYRDEKGVLLYHVVRWNPKHFTQRRPNPAYDPQKPRTDANAEFIYKLPELLASLKEKPDRYVFVLEGEKDVETAFSAGLLATTNPGGALKWKDEYSQFLRGANVVVVPDNDPAKPDLGFSPGKKHALEVADKAHRAGARSVRVVQLPGVPEDGSDFTWWWEQQMKVEKLSPDEAKKRLQEVVARTPPYHPNAPANPDVSPRPVKPAPAAPPVETPGAADTQQPAEKPPLHPSASADFAGLDYGPATLAVVKAMNQLQKSCQSDEGRGSLAEWWGCVRFKLMDLEALLGTAQPDSDKVREAAVRLGAEVLFGIELEPKRTWP